MSTKGTRISWMGATSREQLESAEKAVVALSRRIEKLARDLAVMRDRALRAEEELSKLKKK